MMKKYFGLTIIFILTLCSVFGQTKINSEFNRIRFKSDPNCFGFCPYYLLTIDSIGFAKLDADYVIKKGTEMEIDSAKNGTFIGVLTKKQLKKIISLSLKCASSENDNSGPSCCDAPWKYLTITLKDKEKVISTMFPKNDLKILVDYLYEIIGTNKFDKTKP